MDRALNLLVVDDDRGHTDLLKVLLEELGLPHQCHWAPDGRAALDMLHRRPPHTTAPRPHLILMDLNMPGMNGCEVLKHIKSDPGLRIIPVIVLSQSRSKKDVDSCYGERANAYIPKPTDLESNLTLVREIDRFWGHVASLPPNLLSAERTETGSG